MYVTTTYAPAAVSGVNIMYDGIKYDTGNNFDIVTSEYQAPVTGHYLVASHLFCDNHEAHQRILVNGIEVAHDHMFDGYEPSVVTEPTIILRLNSGDRLAIQKQGAFAGNVIGVHNGRLYTWLSVALINIE